jgi:Uncharacterised protein family (UPF0158)
VFDLLHRRARRFFYKEAVMSKPKVSFSDLEDAFISGGGYEREWWLDKRTGRVILISDGARKYADGTWDVEGAPKWMGEMIEDAKIIMRAFGELPDEGANAVIELDRFVSIPGDDSHDAFEDMEEFIETVTNDRAYNALARALKGDRQFRRFKDALSDNPRLEGQWHTFHNQRLRERIEAWAREEGVELDYSSPHTGSAEQIDLAD